jgi:hypothetical protein
VTLGEIRHTLVFSRVHASLAEELRILARGGREDFGGVRTLLFRANEALTRLWPRLHGVDLAPSRERGQSFVPRVKGRPDPRPVATFTARVIATEGATNSSIRSNCHALITTDE